ncbi:MAG: protein kinase [Tannerella sp.]|nr:protein kinase [Tannerella sp.]
MLRFLFECANGLIVLHAAKMVHRDIKSTNIFRTKDDVCKIGLCYIVKHDILLIDNVCF